MEIKEVLFFIEDNKVFGIDGLNVFFFKKSWGIIKDDFVCVILDFFNECKMFLVVNNILVIFIFKCDKLDNIK